MPPKLRGGKNNEKYETIKKMRPSVEENNVKSNVKSNIVFRKCNQQKIKKHRKNYAPESLEKAVKAVNEGISLRKAAQMHCVPVTSIFRAAKNPTKIRSKCGPPTILTEQEEQDIIQWILYRAERGYPFCREKRIEIIALYPNATHIIQPLDIAVFHPFKDIWKETLSKWEVENVSKVRKEQFPLVLQKALQSYTAEKMNVQGGFKASGLMPFNPEAVEYNVLHKKKTNNKNYNVQTNQANQVPESQQHLVNKEIENKIRHLETFEKNLSQKLLQNFKEAESAECWINDIENKGLFNYWLQIKKAASGISFGTI